jgi:hypothetical protein
MIIYHQDNVAAFAGAHTSYVVAQQFWFQSRVSITAGAAANETIEQARSISRFTFSRVFGRIN